MGLVNCLVEDGSDVVVLVHKWVDKFAVGFVFVYCMIKCMLDKELGMSLRDALEVEVQVQAICMVYPDFCIVYDANKKKERS